MRILVADDSPLMRARIEDALAGPDFQPVVVSDGAGAWERLRQGDIRIAVLDWLMPGIDGVQICRKLAAIPALQSIYVILLTSRNRPEEIAVAFEAGASDYVTKPFAPVELLARVRAGARIVELQTRLTQAHKLEAIGQLASGIAHEINTPIQYIGDNARFLQDAMVDLSHIVRAYRKASSMAATGGDPVAALAEAARLAAATDLDYVLDEAPQALAQSLEGVERVGQIVRAMKDFAHPGTVEKRLANLAKIVDNTLTVARNEWKYVAEVVVEHDPDLPDVPCLPGEIGQVVLNVIVNAAQAIAEKRASGKGRITIATRRSGGSAEIAISDTGCGIPEAVRHRVFDPFFTSKEVGKGTGQGLTIARSIVVEKHAGELSFTTELGVGTTFFVRLPLVEAYAPCADESHEPKHTVC